MMTDIEMERFIVSRKVNVVMMILDPVKDR